MDVVGVRRYMDAGEGCSAHARDATHTVSCRSGTEVRRLCCGHGWGPGASGGTAAAGGRVLMSTDVVHSKVRARREVYPHTIECPDTDCNNSETWDDAARIAAADPRAAAIALAANTAADAAAAAAASHHLNAIAKKLRMVSYAAAAAAGMPAVIDVIPSFALKYSRQKSRVVDSHLDRRSCERTRECVRAKT
jgi:uncharacterized Fe-S cluster protein YjdI